MRLEMKKLALNFPEEWREELGKAEIPPHTNQRWWLCDTDKMKALCCFGIQSLLFILCSTC
jgi:hypothetical protein